MITTDKIFEVSSSGEFENLALEIFLFQADSCKPYSDYIKLLGIDIQQVTNTDQIPFMPIELFKTQTVYCGAGEPQKIFTSSSTTGQTPSQHIIAELEIYEKAFEMGFREFYGDPRDVAIFALLPSYLEREGSSLIYMVDHLIKASVVTGGALQGGFYLNNIEDLLRDMEACEHPKILLGVSYALWDMAESYPTQLSNCTVMETGGMKGRRREMPRDEFHNLLCSAFGVDVIHSEYGMAEMLSQGYSSGNGVFRVPQWVQIKVRDVNDPFEMLPEERIGGINIIDLANVYSCSFLQTSDLGVRFYDGTFKITGRISGSEIRGCNLLVQ